MQRCPQQYAAAFLDGLAQHQLIGGLTASKVETMTEVSLESLFSSLESKAARLNTASDTANATLAAIEKRLVGLNIGLEIWHPAPIAEADSEGDIGPYKTTTRKVTVLGLARVDSKWCLALKPVRLVDGFYEGDMACPFTNEFADGPPVALLSASRTLRLAALAMAPKFLKHLSEHVAKTTNELEQTVGMLE
jgi:hypothetical protein